MKKAGIVAVALVTVILLVSCTVKQRDYYGFAFSTDFNNRFFNTTKPNVANEAIVALYEYYDSLFSTTREGSDVYRINHSQVGEATSVSNETIQLLRLSHKLYCDTDKAFNPLMYALTCLWGFTTSQDNMSIPDETEIAFLLTYADFEYIEYDEIENTVTRLSEYTMLDFGAIAKGYVLDKAREEAIRCNQRDFCLNLGNSILCYTDGIRVGIRPTRASGYSHIGSIFLTSNTVVATSGDYERYFIEDNQRYCHILGKDGKPVSGIEAVTVISRDGALTDALSTILFVMGVDDGIAFITENYPNTSAIFIANNKIVLRESQDMQINFTLKDDAYTVIYDE